MMNKEGHWVKGQDGKNYRLPDTKKRRKRWNGKRKWLRQRTSIKHVKRKNNFKRIQIVPVVLQLPVTVSL